MILYHCHRVMLFIFALPVMQVILFCLAIGRDPVGLHLAVVNHELNQSGSNCEFNDGCSFKMLSCRYLQNLNNVSIIMVSVSSYRILCRKLESCRHLGMKSCINVPASVIIFVCSCVCESESWYVMLRGDRRLRPFRDRVLRKIWPKRRRLEKSVERVLCDLYCTPYFI